MLEKLFRHLYKEISLAFMMCVRPIIPTYLYVQRRGWLSTRETAAHTRKAGARAVLYILYCTRDTGKIITTREISKYTYAKCAPREPCNTTIKQRLSPPQCTVLLLYTFTHLHTRGTKRGYSLTSKTLYIYVYTN